MILLNETKIRMIEPFIFDIDLESTASQISKLQSQNQKSTQLFFDLLEKHAILKSRFQGRNKLFFWNKENAELVKNFILLIEYFRTMEFYQKNPSIKHFIGKITPYIKGTLLLFGSYANNSQNEVSDIDLLIIGSYNIKEVRKIQTIFAKEVVIKHISTFNLNTLTKEVQKKHIFLKNSELYLSEAISWIN